MYDLLMIMIREEDFCEMLGEGGSLISWYSYELNFHVLLVVLVSSTPMNECHPQNEVGAFSTVILLMWELIGDLGTQEEEIEWVFK